MRYYKFDGKIFFNQSDLIKQLRIGDEENLSDDFLLNEGYIQGYIEDVEFDFQDCEYIDCVSSHEDGFVERWKHNDTGIEFLIDVEYFRNEDTIKKL